MEEARQHPALTREQHLFALLSRSSLAAVVATVVGFILFGSNGVMIGLMAFVWLRLGVEITRASIARQLKQNFGWCVLLVLVHAAFACFVTYAFTPYLFGWS